MFEADPKGLPQFHCAETMPSKTFGSDRYQITKVLCQSRCFDAVLARVTAALTKQISINARYAARNDSGTDGFLVKLDRPGSPDNAVSVA